MGLYDRIMIKDNHRTISAIKGRESIMESVRECRKKFPHLEIEVEVDTIDQLLEALHAKVDILLLDNMSTEEMIEAVKFRNEKAPKVLLEASGGITLERVKEIANIGLDFISVGAITHSFRSIDMGLDFIKTTDSPTISN